MSVKRGNNGTGVEIKNSQSATTVFGPIAVRAQPYGDRKYNAWWKNWSPSERRRQAGAKPTSRDPKGLSLPVSFWNRRQQGARLGDHAILEFRVAHERGTGHRMVS